MSTTYACDRCGAATGTSPVAVLSASIDPNQPDARTLTGKPKEIEADLCRTCWMALLMFLKGVALDVDAVKAQGGTP